MQDPPLEQHNFQQQKMANNGWCIMHFHDGNITGYLLTSDSHEANHSIHAQLLTQSGFFNKGQKAGLLPGTKIPLSI